MKLGVPAVVVATEAFRGLAEFEAASWGWEVPLAVVTHPLGGVPAGEVQSRADQVADHVRACLTGAAVAPLAEVEDVEPLTVVPTDPWAFQAFVQDRGWGDGFPVHLPTPDRVARMLAVAAVGGDDPVGPIPPARLHVTARDVAANAVLAGCPDRAYPVVVAALRACLQDRFNLLGILATTHPCGVAVIVSGPAAAELGMRSGASLYGPGSHVNAAIGRAVRLSLQNLGHAWPGPVDKSTQGQPAKYAYCFAENLDASPWPAYHVDRGFAETDSTVTVVAAEGPHNLHDPASSTAENLVQFFVGGMTHCGHNNLYHKGDLFLVVCPEHVQLLTRDGWTRDRLRHALFDRARLPATVMGREAFDHYVSRWPGQPHVDFGTAMLEIAARPEDLHVLVAGGPGKHSSWLPTFGQSFSAIERLVL